MTAAAETPDTKTHRCIDCPHYVEHYQGELCVSCGRCSAHCHEQPARKSRKADA